MALSWEEYLDIIETKYNHWYAERKIKNTSKVIPIEKSLSTKQWVLPTEQVLQYLRNSRSFVLTDCHCRTLGKHCDSPVEVCFLINDFADRAHEKGVGRKVGLDEAEATLKRAAEAGLVHTALYNPDQHLFALCNCCSCCCHDMVLMKARGRDELMAHSDYEAITDPVACTACGLCEPACPFEARKIVDGELRVDPSQCFGCGQCVAACPEEAIVMERRD